MPFETLKPSPDRACLSSKQEAESAHAASLRAREAQDTAERESAAALAQLSEKLGAQIEAREQRLTAERGTHEV